MPDIISTLLIKILTSEEFINFSKERIEALKSRRRLTPKKSYEYIREIYAKTPSYDMLKHLDVPDNSVEIEGTLSTFSPVFPGPANLKRSLHLDFRRNMGKVEQALKKETPSMKKTTMDSLISCSSGQMVMRKLDTNLRIIPLGFYQSIVRNSIAVFVAYDYYEKVVNKLFRKSSNPNFFEARITGHAVPYFNELVEELSNISSLKGFLDWRKYECLKKTKALLIDGKKFKIHFKSNPRYLDGDIWIALKRGNDEEIISRFLELTNGEELNRERNELMNDCLKHFPGSKIIGQFDNNMKIFETDKIP